MAKIVGCTTEELEEALGRSLDTSREIDESDENMRLLNELRTKLPHAQVYTYTYEPLLGMTSVTTPDGETVYYSYDKMGRMTERYRMENGKKVLLETDSYHTPDNSDVLNWGIFQHN